MGEINQTLNHTDVEKEKSLSSVPKKSFQNGQRLLRNFKCQKRCQ